MKTNFHVFLQFDMKTFESGFSDFKALEEKIGGRRINESIGKKSKMRKLKPVSFFLTLKIIF